jgi:PPM family protein phosphatase
MAVDTVSSELHARWSEAPAVDPLEFASALRAAVEGANTAIHAHAVRHPALRGMGTTCTAAAVLGDTLYLAQVGDSRAYLVRGGRAVQLTKDQSLIQRLLDAGELTPEQAETSERRNIILQALGPDPVVKVDVTVQRLCADDLLVLCSDGLSGQVNGEQIGQFAADESVDLVRLCERLIDEANATGGPDNITVVAAAFSGAGLARVADGEAPRHCVFNLPPSDGDTAPRLLPTPRADRSPTRAYLAVAGFAVALAIVAVLLKLLV